MRPVVTAEEMRVLDERTIRDVGLPGAVLMETAGRAVAGEIEAILADRLSGARVAVVAGTGNNGGDGHVIARVLRARGADAIVYLAGARDRVRGDAALHLAAYEKSGGPVVLVDSAEGLAAHRAAIARAHVVVDAVFGTGLARDVEGHLRAVLEAIGDARGAVVSVDVPSGLDADAGRPLGLAVTPEVTVTMGFLKPALASSPGVARCGRVEVAEIGIPSALLQARLGLLEAADVRPLVPRPDDSAHKGRRGHVLVVAGWPGKRGAGRLTAVASLRAGAGLVTLAARRADEAVDDPVMTAALGEDDPVAELRDRAERVDVLAVGPGLDTGAEGRALVDACLDVDAGLVLDADALNHLARGLGVAAAARAERAILTPHPGEAARLLGSSVAEVEADRIAAVRALAAESRAVVILKGARTLICDGRDGGDFVAINPTGGAALATAGTGDVLTGVLAALLAQGLAPVHAAWLGCYVHGLAGRVAAGGIGPVGVTSADVRDAIPGGFAALLGDG